MTDEQERKIEWFVSGITGEFYFRIVADNGETIAASEGYVHIRDMFDTINEYFGTWKVVEEQP